MICIILMNKYYDEDYKFIDLLLNYCQLTINQNTVSFMSSSIQKNKKYRAVSAKVDPNDNSRHLKTQPSQYQQQSMVKDRTYITFNQTKYDSLKRHQRLRTTFNICPNDVQISRLLPKKVPKQREELFEQNLQLKQKINKLQSELGLQRSKIQAQRKKTSHFTKKFGRQFQKQLYWTGKHQHLITGIKTQYERLKQEYQRKCEQCSQIKKNVEYCNQQQYRIYAQTLQQQNRQLVSKVQSFLQPKYLDDRSSSQATQYLINQANIKNQKLYKKNVALSDKIANLQTNLNEKQKKIMFLQKLLIERDNNQYHSNRKAKKLEKEKIILDQTIRELKQLINNGQINHKDQLQRLKQSMDRKYHLQKQIFERSLDQKSRRIQKLQKQVGYLSTLLSYWRPLDQLKNENELFPGNIRKYRQNEDQEGSQIYLSPNQPSIKNQASNMSNLFQQEGQSIRLSGKEVKKASSVVRGNVSNRNHVNQNSSVHLQHGGLNSMAMQTSQRQLLRMNTAQLQHEKLIKMYQNRVQKTAGVRHSDKAIKTRKINLRQIQYLAQTLKYRLVGFGFDLQQAKKQFDIKPSAKNSNTQLFVEDPWQKKYITMKECKQLLQKQPFLLDQAQAHNLSRYIVEDTNEDFVYCDQENQVMRPIAKSIFKAIIGDYQLPDSHACKSEWKIVLQKNRRNLSLALQAMAPAGTINANKYLDILYSLGMQVSEPCRLWLAGWLITDANHIDKCEYKKLFNLNIDQVN